MTEQAADRESTKKKLGKAAVKVLRVAGFFGVFLAWYVLPASFSWGGLLPLMLAGFFALYGLAFTEPRDLAGFIACLAGTVAGGFFGHTDTGATVFVSSLAAAVLVVAWEVLDLFAGTPLGD